jgi:hypothetical protein
MNVAPRVDSGLEATDSERCYSHSKVATISCASFSQNAVYVHLDGTNTQSQLPSDFLI